MNNLNNQQLPYSLYQPGQFADLADSSFASSLWEYLSTPATVTLLQQSAVDGVPAVMPISEILRERFAAEFDLSQTDRFERHKILCLNMIKQIMEHLGYQHIACGLLPAGSFFSSAAIFSKD